MVAGQEVAIQTNDDLDLQDERPALNVSKALKLRIQNHLSYAEIGRTLGGYTKQAVFLALRPFLNMIAEPEARQAYKENKAEVLEACQMKLVSEMLDPEKLEKASVNNLAYAASNLDQMIRLDRGESTANIATYSMMSREQGALEAELAEIQAQLPALPHPQDDDPPDILS